MFFSYVKEDREIAQSWYGGSPPLGTQPLSISYSVIPRVWPLISGPSMAAGILANIQAAGWRMDKEVAVLS